MILYAGGIYRCGETDQALIQRQAEILKDPAHPTHGPAHVSPVSPPPRLEHGRWIVDCPCGSGAGVSRTGLACCMECGAQMTITLPDATTRAAVETLLSERRLPQERNWTPATETLEDIRTERPPA